MSKIILSFNMPEEQEEYELAYNGSKYARILDEFDNELRKVTKYETLEAITDHFDTTATKKFTDAETDLIIETVLAVRKLLNELRTDY